MAKATARAMGRNRNRPELGIKASGASTSSVLQLATISGSATSLAPFRAASRTEAPWFRWRSVFSRQMMALSTIGPIARASPLSVIMLMVCPDTYNKVIAAITAMGMVSTAMRVMRHWPRKTRITSEHRTAPRMPSIARLLMDWRT